MTAEADSGAFTFAFPGSGGDAPRTVGAVIADFLRDAESGRVLDPGGQRYSRESLRDMRSALAHVDSALGETSVDRLDGRRVADLLDELTRDGLGAARIDSIVVTLHRLSTYAGTPDAGLPDPVVPSPEPAASAPPAEAPPAAAPRRPTPTMEMLGVARTVATWTVRAVVFLFALVVLLLILEL